MSQSAQTYGDALTDTYTTTQFNAGLSPRLGDRRKEQTSEGEKEYVFALFVDAVDGAASKMAVLAGDADANTATKFNATIDVSGGSALAGLRALGMCVGAVDVSAAPYAWLQRGGIANFTAGSSAIIAGDFLMPDTTEDGDLTEATAGTNENICAIAMATVADNAVGKCLLYNMP